MRLDRAITRKLWAAIRQDSIAAFAKRYPFTVTPVRTAVSPPTLGGTVRIVLASLAVLVVLAGVVVGGYVYINHVAAGIGRMPVMFANAHVDQKR